MRKRNTEIDNSCLKGTSCSCWRCWIPKGNLQHFFGIFMRHLSKDAQNWTLDPLCPPQACSPPLHPVPEVRILISLLYLYICVIIRPCYSCQPLVKLLLGLNQGCKHVVGCTEEIAPIWPASFHFHCYPQIFMLCLLGQPPSGPMSTQLSVSSWQVYPLWWLFQWA